VDPEVFDAMVAAGEFLEHAEYSGHLYGTAWSGLDQRLTAGCDVLLEIETVGAAQIRRRGVGAFLIFLLPPSLDSLAERLRGRGTDGEAEVERRLRIAETEFRAAHHFDALVINHTVHETVVEVREIIAAVRAGTAARVTRERSCERLATLLPPPLDEWVQP
jgi:guanylate kinase